MKGKKAFKSFMAKLYGFGAAIVIMGALFKIQHWPGAGIMLTIGLTVEAIIFFFSAFEKPHEDPDWSLVYPELAGMPVEDKPAVSKSSGGSITQELDKMLADAKIGPELIDSLGSGLRNLSDNAAKMSSMSDASVATSDYVTSLNSAAKSVSQFSSSSSKAAEALEGFSDASNDSHTYVEQIQKASKNLASLNGVYELQLQGSNEHLKNSNKLFEGVEELMSNLSDSLDDTKKFRQEMSQLSNNLSALNNVYGNMLSAMNVNR